MKLLDLDLLGLKCVDRVLKARRDHFEPDPPVFTREDRVADETQGGSLSLGKSMEVRDEGHVGFAHGRDEILFLASPDRARVNFKVAIELALILQNRLRGFSEETIGLFQKALVDLSL
jgi:hypothetical protein